MPDKLHSFPFSADERSRVVILGSMPGVESLKQQQYYAHPRNLFWGMMDELFGAGRHLPYEARLARLRAHRIALWDVAHRCRRSGSLDANITDVEANDFAKLFATSPQIHTIFFNGQKSAELFRKLVQPGLQHTPTLITLPSSSPANASISLENKRAAWRQILTATES